METGEDTLVLPDSSRTKLDGIVQQMIQNKESDDDIQFVVNDFKTKYGQKKSSAQNGEADSTKVAQPVLPQSQDGQQPSQSGLQSNKDSVYSVVTTDGGGGTLSTQSIAPQKTLREKRDAEYQTVTAQGKKLKEISAVANTQGQGLKQREEGLKVLQSAIEGGQDYAFGQVKEEGLIPAYNEQIQGFNQELEKAKVVESELKKEQEKFSQTYDVYEDTQRKLNQQLEKDFSYLDQFAGGAASSLAKGVGGVIETIGDFHGMLYNAVNLGDPNFVKFEDDDNKITDKIGQSIMDLGKNIEDTQSIKTPDNFQGFTEKVLKGETPSFKQGLYFTVQSLSTLAPSVAASLYTGGLTSGMAIGAAMTYGDAYDQAKQEGFSDEKAALVSTAITIPATLLDRYGLGKILKGFEGTSALSKATLKNLAGKELTTKAIFQAAAKTFKEKVSGFASHVVKGTLPETITEGLQEGLQMGVVEGAAGRSPFSKKVWEASVGGALGGTTAAGAINVASGAMKINPSAYEFVTQSTEEEMENFQKKLEIDTKKGIYTPQEAENILKNIEEIKITDAKVPANITGLNERTKAINLIREQEALQKQTEGKNEILAQPLTERIEEINVELQEIVTPTEETAEAITPKEELPETKNVQEEKPSETAVTKKANMVFEVNAADQRAGGKPFEGDEILSKEDYDTFKKEIELPTGSKDFRVNITTATERLPIIKAKIDLINALEKEGKFEEANKLHEEILSEGEKLLQDVFVDMPDVIATVNRSKGNFYGDSEPSFIVDIKAPEKNIPEIQKRLANLAQGWKQKSVHISEILPKLPKGKKYGEKNEDGSIYEPNIDIFFDRELTDKELSDINKALQEKGFAGATFHPDKKGINLYNVTAYGTTKEFRKKLPLLGGILQQFAGEHGGLGSREPIHSVRKLWNIGEEGHGEIGYENVSGKVHGGQRGEVKPPEKSGEPPIESSEANKLIEEGEPTKLDKSVNELKDAWNDFQNPGIIFDPRANDAKTLRLVKAIGNVIKEGTIKTVEDLIEFVKDKIGHVLSKADAEILLERGKKETGITHEQTKVTAEELGLEEREAKPETVAGWDAEADRRLRQNPHTIPDLLKKLEEGGVADEIDQRVLLRHMASLEAKIRTSPTDALIDEFDKARKLSDVQAGTKVGRSLRARQGAVPVEDSLAELLVAKKESAGVDKLTPQQKADVTKMFDEYQKAKADAEAKIAQLEEANAKLRADQEFVKQRQSVKQGRKTHEEHVAYRDKIVNDISAKLKAIRSTGQSTIIPYARELAAITPDVLKLMKDHIEEKVTDLGEIVKNIHGQLKDYIPQLQEKDVRDIISGKYNEPKKTRNELAATASSLKSEAILINKLEALENGEVPKVEAKKVQHNQKIAELRKQIKDADVSQLVDLKKRNEQATKKIEEKIANKEYTTEKKVSALDNPELKRKHPELYREALNSLVAKEDARNKLETDRVNDELKRRGTIAKIRDFTVGLIATTRAIKSGIDDSFVGVQAGLAMLANPRSGAKAFKEQWLDFFSEQRFRREIARVHNSDNWRLIEQSGLDILDPASMRKAKHEETFDKDLLKKDFVIKGKKFNVGRFTTRPFERLFTSMGNHFRENLFLRQADVLQSQGKTFETHPEEFKGIAQVINTMTGRGKTAKAVEMASDLITPIIWSPKLIASGLNILGVSDIGGALGMGNGYYTNLSPAARKYAISQTVKGIGMGVTLMYAAVLAGADVDDDPTSVTFGTWKARNGTTLHDIFGDNSYNIFGRFTPFVRQIAMQLTGKKTTPKYGTETLGERYGGATKGSELLKFARGKVTPFVGVVIDWRTGKRYDGSDFTWADAGKDLITPFAVNDITKGLEQDGTKSILTRGVPAFVGIKVSNEKDFDKSKNTQEGKIKTVPVETVPVETVPVETDQGEI